MVATTIPISEFEEYLTDLIRKEMLNADETLDDVLHRRAIQLRGKLQDVSPKSAGGGNYAKGWRVKTAQRNHEKVKIIYNKNRPDLTIYLEYGTKNEDGTVRMESRQHIRLAAEETMDEMIDELIARL